MTNRRNPIKYQTIQLQPADKEVLKHFQLKLNGAAGVRLFSQGEVIAILVELGEQNMPAAVDIARKYARKIERG